MFEHISIPKVGCHIMFVVFIVFVVGEKKHRSAGFTFLFKKTSTEDEEDPVVHACVSVQQHAYNRNKVEKTVTSKCKQRNFPLCKDKHLVL